MADSEAPNNAATPIRIPMPERLDTSAAASLHERLKAQSGKDLLLDFSSVRTMGGLCLQLLLNARHHWQLAGNSVALTNMSSEISKTLADFGTEPSALTTEGAR